MLLIMRYITNLNEKVIGQTYLVANLKCLDILQRSVTSSKSSNVTSMTACLLLKPMTRPLPSAKQMQEKGHIQFGIFSITRTFAITSHNSMIGSFSLKMSISHTQK